MSRDIPTFRISTCEHCNRPIAEIRDPHSGATDWYSHGGDFGCDMSPDCTDDAVGGHEPRLTSTMMAWWESHKQRSEPAWASACDHADACAAQATERGLGADGKILAEVCSHHADVLETDGEQTGIRKWEPVDADPFALPEGI